MKHFFWAAGLFFSLIFSTQTWAEDYLNGIEGIKAGSLPGPGFYTRLYTVMYSADEFKDDNGDDLEVSGQGKVDFDTDILGIAPRFLWVTDKQFLGGNFGMNVVIPFLALDYDINRPGMMPDESANDSLRLGDIAFDPVMLGWNRDRYDVAAGLGFFAPTGDFDKNRSLSIGNDHWTTMLSLGGTYYLDQKKTWSVSALGRYEIHFEDQSRDITRGDDFHVEFGIGKTLMRVLDVGLAGYAQWQVTDDKGSDLTAMNTTDDNRVFALGPELSGFIPPWKLQISGRVLKEFGAENRPEGTKAVVVLTKFF